jgi:hypothetical protein
VFSPSRLRVQFRRPNQSFRVRNVITSYLPRRTIPRHFALFELIDLDERMKASQQAELTRQPSLTGTTAVCLPPHSLRLANGQLLVSLQTDANGMTSETLFVLVHNRRCKQLAPRHVTRRMICVERLLTSRSIDNRWFERPDWTRRLRHSLRTLGPLFASARSIDSELFERTNRTDDMLTSTWSHKVIQQLLNNGSASSLQGRSTLRGDSSTSGGNETRLEAGQPLYARLQSKYYLFGLHVPVPWPFQQPLRQANLALFFNVRRHRHLILDQMRRSHRKTPQV